MGDVIGGTARLQLIEKPEPLLGKGEGQGSVSCDRRYRRKRGGCGKMCLLQKREDVCFPLGEFNVESRSQNSLRSSIA